MLDSGHWILCYKLGYEALLMDPERPEAAEVLFFLFLHRNETDRAEDCLTIAKNYGGNDPKYLTWEILLLNDQGNNERVLELYEDGRICLDRDDPRLSELVLLGGDGPNHRANRVAEARGVGRSAFPRISPSRRDRRIRTS